MRAARIHEPGRPLSIDEVPVPEVSGNDVLIRIGGAGVCHSDVHIRAGTFPTAGERPARREARTLGHENAGTIERIGPAVVGFEEGEAVAVWGGRGCGACRICRQEDEQACGMGNWFMGGYADYLHLPDTRFLVKLCSLDPVEAAPLTDAGLTPYRAIRKTLPHLYPGAHLVLVGIGGLGHLAMQLAAVLTPAARVIAVDVNDAKLEQAAALGAHHVIDGRGDAVGEILRATGGEGAQGVIDLVGTDASLRLSAAVVGRKGILVVVGLGGGSFPYSFFGTRAEAVVTTSYWGSYNELCELLALAEDGRVRADISRFRLEEVNEVLDALERGELRGRGVLVP